MRRKMMRTLVSGALLAMLGTAASTLTVSAGSQGNVPPQEGLAESELPTVNGKCTFWLVVDSSLGQPTGQILAVRKTGGTLQYIVTAKVPRDCTPADGDGNQETDTVVLSS